MCPQSSLRTHRLVRFRYAAKSSFVAVKRRDSMGPTEDSFQSLIHPFVSFSNSRNNGAENVSSESIYLLKSAVVTNSLAAIVDDVLVSFTCVDVLVDM